MINLDTYSPNYAIIFIILLVGTFNLPPELLARNAGPYASGHGNLPVEGNKLRTFTFNARILKNGRTTGNLVVKNRDLGIRVKAKINCLRIVGNQATMSGFIIQVSGDPELIGENLWFRVEDNGEGQRNISDRITLVIAELDEPGDPEDCNDDFDELELMNIKSGNIQVQH